MQGCDRIFNRFRHCIYFGLLRNIFTTHNSIDSSFHTGEVLILVLLQGICLGNGFVNFSVISILILQGCNRILDSLCHFIYFRLLSKILVTHNSLDSSFHTGEVLILVLLQSICLSNGCVNLCIISVLVLQGCNGIFNCFRHLVYFGLLGNVLVPHNGIHCGVYSGEILVVVLVQGLCLSNGFINLCIISKQPDKLQGKGYVFTFSTVVFVGNGVFATIHCQHVSTYCPTAPVACLGNDEVSRQGRKVKCGVIVNNDLVDIVSTIRIVRDFCVVKIKRGQLVASAA